MAVRLTIFQPEIPTGTSRTISMVAVKDSSVKGVPTVGRLAGS